MPRNRADDEDDRPRRKKSGGMPVWGWVLLGVGGLIFVGGGLMCAGMLWVGKKANQQVAAEKDQQKKVNGAPDLVITPDELNASLEGNTAAASKYEGKVLQVSGPMDEVTTIGGKSYLRFHAKKFSLVRFVFDDPKMIAHLQKGDIITVQGILDKISLTVEFSPAVLVK